MEKDNEIRFSARHVLRAMLVDAVPLDAAIARLESKPKRWGKWFGWSVFAAVLLACWGHAGWQAWEFNSMFRNMDFFGDGYARARSAYIDKVSSTMTADQRLLLFGNRDEVRMDLRWKALADRYPDDPACYSQYVSACISTNGALPLGFEETVERIDPANGWFQLLKAASIGKGAVERAPYGSRRKPNEYLIRDQARLDEALSHCRKALSAPVFKTYVKELNQRRSAIPLIRHDKIDELQAGRYGNADFYASGIHASTAGKLFMAQADSLATANQPDRLKEHIRDWKLLVRRLAESESESDVVIEPMVTRSVLTGGATVLERTAGEMKLEPESTRFKRIVAWKAADDSRTRSYGSGLGPAFRSGSTEINESMNLMARFAPLWNPPPDEILKPGRRMDHALLGRLTTAALSVSLLMAVGVLSLYRLRHGKLMRLLSFSLTRLLGAVDYLWIVGLGLLLPFLWFLLVRHSPWGELDRGVMEEFPKAIRSQATGLFFTVLMATTLAARWRVGLRVAMLDLGRRWSWFTWLFLVLTAAAMPVMHLWVENPGWDERTLLIPLSIPTIWWLVTVTRSLFRSSEHFLGQALVARAVGRAFLIGVPVAAVMMAGFYAEERYWVDRDPLIQNHAPLFPFEEEVSRMMNQQNLELLDMLERD